MVFRRQQRIRVPVTAVFVLALAAGCAPRDEAPGDAARLLTSLPTSPPVAFDAVRAADFARLSLTCVDREYPNKPGNVVNGDETVRPPRDLHPAFYGCFDWHSAVHGHWTMVRLLRTFPDLPVAGEIRRTLERHLDAETIEAEVTRCGRIVSNLLEFSRSSGIEVSQAGPNEVLTKALF